MTGRGTDPEDPMPIDLQKTKRVTLGTMCFALFMVMLDSTVVNLSLIHM